MKNRWTRVFLLVLCLCLLAQPALADGLLPELRDVFGVEMPNLGKALRIPSETDETLPDGSRILNYKDISEQDYSAFSEYLLTFGCELADYSVEGSAVTFTLAKQGKTFTFVYDSEACTAVLNYPVGTHCEEFDYAAYVEEQEAAAAAAEREAKLAALKSTGSYVTFGTYPQTKAGNDSTPIEWLVLDYDAANNKALLISRYALDCQQYNTKYTSVTWETCTLRGWLNGEFVNKAFSAEEQKAIITTDVDNSNSQGYNGYGTDGGKNTKDKIFLLSYAEANQYFGVQYYSVDGAMDNLRSRVAPTDHAVRQGVWTSSSYTTSEGKAAAWWWLRSHGSSASSAADVRGNGALYYDGVNYNLDAVRPAFWLDLNSDIF